MIRFHAALVLLVCLLTSGCGSSGPSGPADAIRDFVRSTFEGDCDGVLRVVHPDLVAGRDPAEICAGIQAAVSEGEVRHARVEFLREEVQGNLARVRYRVILDGERLPAEDAELMLIDGAWRITAME